MGRCDPRIPPAYRADPQTLLARAAPMLRDAALRVPAGERCGAVLLGATGLGKSSVAAWLVRRWQSKCMSGQVVPQGWPSEGAASLAWLDAIEATDAERRYKLGSGDPYELEQACRADWLVFDDIGRATSPALVQLVLSRRYQRELPTIVTSGLTPEELSAHIGAAAIRRVIEWQGQPGILVNGFAKAAA